MDNKETNKRLIYSNSNISHDLVQFNHVSYENGGSPLRYEEEVELSESKPSEAYYNDSSDMKQSLSTPNLTEIKQGKRKSSLKKRNWNELFNYNSGSTYSCKSK